jgi:hypothetical protein
MRKALFFCCILLASVLCDAQNVGIGTATPVERLDVNGNINLSGTIMANGSAGQPQQVLTTNSSGSLSWTDLYAFQNRATIRSTQAWVVPAGVTRIAAEAWGSGGGGSSRGGGGGGGYICGFFTVTPGQSISITIGNPGVGSTNDALEGAATTVLVGAVTITAEGGAYGIGRGNGGAFSVTGSFTNYFGINGQNGKQSTTQFISSPTKNYEILTGGAGGDAAMAENTGGAGVYRMLEIGFAYPVSSNGSQGRFPGGGGGAGSFIISNSTTLAGYQGGRGMVSIRY